MLPKAVSKDVQAVSMRKNKRLHSLSGFSTSRDVLLPSIWFVSILHMHLSVHACVCV